MKREIVLDTETTGLNPATGDRLVEIGCVELINHIPTGNNYHVYCNPERDMPEEAFKVHGLGNEFLADKPLFKDIADDFLDFVADSVLVIHNAPFDMGFLQAELEWASKRRLDNEVIDTVMLARKKHPGARVNLDALCRHYGIDNTRRTLHGALLDSEILAEVYLELLGGRQVGLSLAAQTENQNEGVTIKKEAARQRPAPLNSRLTQDQIERHKQFVLQMNEEALWAKYWS
ncbi:DNA polymerase III subunit epsilon [Maritalea sp. S77]|uniref:DNA polymerase III subunit epsilon n=1 Tax=Maritalea sp. S77 TaxID=3415125 RepID=UPI003C7D17DA